VVNQQTTSTSTSLVVIEQQQQQQPVLVRNRTANEPNLMHTLRLSTCALVVAVAVLYTIEPASGACANACSGHGTCGYEGDDVAVCACEGEWNATADCSERVCANGIAWFDHATAENVAHAQAECSNMGTCDRTTGQCVCAEGFTGLACERTTCPSTSASGPCSGNGECMTLREAASTQDNRRLFTSTTYTSIWDADKLMGCVCDPG
jgi:hypothetical protein